jgi:starch phosphorylase
VLPLYYDRGAMGFSPEWVKMAKRSIMTLLPRFNSQRMVGEYLNRFYVPASRRHGEFVGNQYALARELAQWKRRVRDAWGKVSMRALDLPKPHAMFGDKVRFNVMVNVDGLQAEDVAVELLMTNPLHGAGAPSSYMLHAEGERQAGNEQRYSLDLAPELCGKLEFRVRAFPYHRALSHRFEMGLMKWI